MLPGRGAQHPDQMISLMLSQKRLNVVIKHFTGSSDSPGTLAAFVQPKTSGPSTAPVKGIYLSVENSIDGEKVDGVVDLSADDAKRKTQECKCFSERHPCLPLPGHISHSSS